MPAVSRTRRGRPHEPALRRRGAAARGSCRLCAPARYRRKDFVEVSDAEQMAFVLVEGEFGVWDGVRLVAAHRWRDVDVFPALPDVHFHGDVFEAEAPRSGVELRLPCGAAR